MTRTAIAAALEGSGLAPLSRSTVSRILSRPAPAVAPEPRTSVHDESATPDADELATKQAEAAYDPTGYFGLRDVIVEKKRVALRLRGIVDDKATPAAVAVKAAVELAKLLDVIRDGEDALDREDAE
jgi:hypothetical protein